MRRVDLRRPADHPDARTARLTRHLTARLGDLGPGGPEVLESDQRRGRVSVRFPGRSTEQILAELAQRGVCASQEETAVFYLSPQVSFEDLDYTWGCLFDILL